MIGKSKVLYSKSKRVVPGWLLFSEADPKLQSFRIKGKKRRRTVMDRWYSTRRNGKSTTKETKRVSARVPARLLISVSPPPTSALAVNPPIRHYPTPTPPAPALVQTLPVLSVSAA